MTCYRVEFCSYFWACLSYFITVCLKTIFFLSYHFPQDFLLKVPSQNSKDNLPTPPPPTKNKTSPMVSWQFPIHWGGNKDYCEFPVSLIFAAVSLQRAKTPVITKRSAFFESINQQELLMYYRGKLFLSIIHCFHYPILMEHKKMY